MGGQRILHVALADDWEGCLRFGEYDVSTLATPFDDTGYIHATTSTRLAAVLDHVYAHVRLPLLLIVLDVQALADTGIAVDWHSTAGGASAPRIVAPFPMVTPVVVTTIPLERRERRWAVPDSADLCERPYTPTGT